MKREHLECLWEQCNDGCLGPPFQPVPKKVWRELVAERIVSEGFEPDDVFPFDEDNEYGNMGVRCFCRDDAWEVSGFSPEELQRLHEEGKISIHSIELEALARHTAEQWKIKPVFWELEIEDCTVAYLIGWKGKDTAVVVSNFGGKNGPLLHFLWDVRGVVREDLRVMFEEGAFGEPDEENREETSQGCPWVCKYLYVISIGSSFGRSPKTQEELDRSRIICLGTKDFLTNKGQPIWDAKVKLRLPPTFSADSPVLESICFDDSIRMYTCAGDPLDLTSLQTELFRMLLDNRGRVVSKQELARAIWPENSNIEQDGALKVHIHEQRRKFVEKGLLAIETAGRRGYRLLGKVNQDIEN